MDSLAYLHLELAREESEDNQDSDSNNIGASWDEKAWDEIFDSLDEEITDEEEKE
jgi:hypothetical protein